MNALPYIYVPPDGPESPLLVSVPHAGVRIPAADRSLIVADDTAVRQDADLHVDRLYENAAPMGAHLLAGTVSRFVLDLNRAPEDLDPEICPDLAKGRDKRARSLIWRETTFAKPVQARALTREEVMGRIERVHTPYHNKLQSVLAGLKERHGFAVLLDAHSMPSVGRAGHHDTGRPRAHVVPGDNHGTSCSAALTELVVEHFRERDLTVSLNDPYSGGYITQTYGRPQEGVHAIQVELSRALYLHEEVPWWAGAPALELQRILEALLEKLMAFRP